MKKIHYILIGLVVTLFASCEPIEDRDVLSNSFNPDNIQLSVERETPGSNQFTLKMNTKGVTGYWDYISGVAYTDEVLVTFPVTGEYTYSFNVTTPYMPNGVPSETEYITKTIDVQIDQLDVPLDDPYYKIAGETLAGKTWVFAGVPFDNTRWWYMAPPDNPTGDPWWNAAGECCPPANKDFVQDATAEINFNLLGDYTYTLGDDVIDGVKWKFNSDYTELTISDPTVIPGYQNEWGEPRANAEGKYQVVELTDDKLMLYTNQTIHDTGNIGWVWIFKPKAN